MASAKPGIGQYSQVQTERMAGRKFRGSLVDFPCCRKERKQQIGCTEVGAGAGYDWL